MPLFIKRESDEDDSLPVIKSIRRIDEECPKASAPPPFAESVPLPLHQNYEEDHHRNHSRRKKQIKSNKTAPSESSTYHQEKKQNNGRKGACNHLAYALFLLCIVWPLALVSANLWILTKPLGSVSIYLDKIPHSFERLTKYLTNLLVGENLEGE